MTWGTHCSMCGKESCNWANGMSCEGLEFPERVAKRDKFERLPWWKRLFRSE